MPLRVGMLARRCGITVHALHYYDQTGLLKPIGRSTSGYRLYDEASVSTIRTIQAYVNVRVRAGAFSSGGSA